MERSGNKLLGRFDSVIGEKHRTAFPKKFRDILGDALIVTKGLETCLVITTDKNWEALVDGIRNDPFTDSDKRELQRYLFGNAAEIVLDSLRRFIIPGYLLEYANLEKEVIFIGIDNRVEVWDKKEWEVRQQKFTPDIAKIADRLGERRSHE